MARRVKTGAALQPRACFLLVAARLVALALSLVPGRFVAAEPVGSPARAYGSRGQRERVTAYTPYSEVCS
jgi:hypothetical protein